MQARTLPSPKLNLNCEQAQKSSKVTWMKNYTFNGFFEHNFRYTTLQNKTIMLEENLLASSRIRPEIRPIFFSKLGPNPTRKARLDFQLCDNYKSPLTMRYSGPYLVIQKHNKYFVILNVDMYPKPYQ